MRDELKKYEEYLLKTSPAFIKICEETAGMTSQEIAEKYHINMDIFREQAK